MGLRFTVLFIIWATTSDAHSCRETAELLAARASQAELSTSERQKALRSLQQLAAETPLHADFIYYLVLRVNSLAANPELLATLKEATQEIRHFVDE